MPIARLLSTTSRTVGIGLEMPSALIFIIVVLVLLLITALVALRLLIDAGVVGPPV